jgi:hypothetical protein
LITLKIKKKFNQLSELSCRFEQLRRFAFFGKVNGMDSEIYSRTSVRGRRFIFQVLNIHFLTEETEHDARLHHVMGLSPARTSSPAATRLPTATAATAAPGLSTATSAGALFQSPATGTLPATAAPSRLRLPTGAL